MNVRTNHVLTGYLPDGTRFDSSRDRGRPLKFRLGASQVVPGLGKIFFFVRNRILERNNEGNKNLEIENRRHE